MYGTVKPPALKRYGTFFDVPNQHTSTADLLPLGGDESVRLGKVSLDCRACDLQKCVRESGKRKAIGWSLGVVCNESV